MPLRLLFLCLLMTSCAGPRMIETKLYFGQLKPNGGAVTKEEWKDFKAKHISGVFKEGSTTVDATGNWLDPVSRELIAEPTYIIIYYHKRSSRASARIDSLRNLYKRVFEQQSVLRVDRKVHAQF